MNEETCVRELWVIYHGSTEPELVVDGTTTDLGILDLFHNIFGRESDAWLLHTVGQLPDWWRLVDVIQARNLTEHRDREERPKDDADLRWKRASFKERMSYQRGWKIVQGSNGGGNQIYRVAHDRNQIASVSVEDLEITPVEIPEPSKLIIPEKKLVRV